MVSVSVIIPVYRAEPFIERCARSLLAQSLSSIEFIFIDDCSPDHSFEVLLGVLECFPDRKEAVRIIRNSQHMGISESRRLALQFSRGEYIGWCDADDWIDPDMYQAMYESIVKTHADIAYCNYWKEYGDRKEEWTFSPQPNPHHSLQHASKNHVFSYTQWNQLVRRDIAIYAANQITACNCGEDLMTLIYAYYRASTVCHVPQSLYHYNQANPCSIMTRRIFTWQDWESQRQNIDRIVSLLSPDLYPEYALTCQWLKFKIKEKMLSVFPDLHSYYYTYPESYRDIARFEYIPLPVRRKLRLIYCCYPAFWLYHQLFRYRNRQ